ADRNRSHWSTSKTPSYTKSVSWQHHPWRDTEPLRRTSREHYPQAFRMTQKDIDDAPMVPSIPPLLAEDKR
uniref:non-oxidative hydroxyarylic acid decarboxylases subunit D n=1 Tax=Salmonella enterica TaxID=28901 RepID=UPI0020C3DD1D